MTAKQEMKNKIREHGEKLKNYFGLSDTIDPAKLCKKLFKLENRGHAIAEALCNGDEILNADAKLSRLVNRAQAILHGATSEHLNIFGNRDPRGHFLKLENAVDFPVRDWGGYGIIAPNFRL